MRNVFIVFFGGGLGSIVRYQMGRWIAGHNYLWPFPLGTFAVNTAACFVLGAVVGMAEEKQLINPSVKLLLAVGFCGGFSTFSTFSLETLQLLQKEQWAVAASYIAASIMLCLAATFGGLWAVKQWL